MALRYCNVYEHHVQGIQTGATTNLNNAGDPDSNTFPRTLSMVIQPFQDSVNLTTGEDVGWYYMSAVDSECALTISGWSGTTKGNWIDYVNENDGSWDGNYSTNSGCPLIGTEFDPAGIPIGGNAYSSSRRNGHDFWRSRFSNGELTAQFGGDGFDYGATDGWEPNLIDPQHQYRHWTYDGMLAYVAGGQGEENLESAWPANITDIIAVDTHNPKIEDENNRIIVIAKFEEGFDWDAAMPTTTGGPFPNAENYGGDNLDYLMVRAIDFNGAARWTGNL